METPTNQKLDVNYTGTDGKTKKVSSDVSPSIMLKKDEVPEPTPEPTPKPDNTIAPDPIPQTGDNTAFVVFGIAVAGIALAVCIKNRNNK